MDADVAILKHRADQADLRMERVEGKLDRMDEKLTAIQVALSRVPSTGALWGMIATVVTICAASVAIVVGILTWLQGLHLH